MSLTILEQLYNKASLQDIQVYRHDLPERIRGLYIEHGDFKSITINNCVNTQAEEVDIMAEEIGHFIVGGGDLLLNNSVDSVNKRKYELKAKCQGYKLIIPPAELYEFLLDEVPVWEIAEYYECTETFVLEAIECYKTKGLLPSY